MKKTALLLLIAACLGIGGVRAEPPAATSTESTAVPQTEPKRADAEPCEPAVGSRIAPKRDRQGKCSRTGSASTRSYSRDDLLSTGQTDNARALQQLDPTITRP